MDKKTKVAAIGAGRMGRGLAHVFAYAGHEVKLLDAKKRKRNDFLELEKSALTEIRSTITLMAELGQITDEEVEEILDRVSVYPRDKAREALENVQLIFEGVPEISTIKLDTLAFISKLASPKAIIASTTSTMMVDELGQAVSSPKRFLNAHWLNPAFLIPLVELSIGKNTSQTTIKTLKEFLETIGKVPVVLQASPGFAVPRIQSLAMSEALRAVEEGVASAEEIDKAIRVGFGIRFAIIGLVEFVDWGGNDILNYAGKYLEKAFNSERFKVPKIAECYMKEGRNGLREKYGFYDYRNIDADEYQRQTLVKLFDLLKHLGLTAPVGGVSNHLESPAARATNRFLKS